uniref:Uncharacterized protein n=1 Tax=Heterorhabditis bacteriophora TaxID=37862 RepID=A0A1I7X412_HETBA
MLVLILFCLLTASVSQNYFRHGQPYYLQYYRSPYYSQYRSPYGIFNFQSPFPSLTNSFGQQLFRGSFNVDQYGNSYIGSPRNGIFITCNGRGCPARG